MGDREIKNAVIDYAEIRFERGTVLTVSVGFGYGGSGQGLGAYVIDEPLKDAEGRFVRRRGHAVGTEYIRRVMEVADVENWSDLPGTPVRVEATMSKVFRMGHYLKDKWFTPGTLEHESETP